MPTSRASSAGRTQAGSSGRPRTSRRPSPAGGPWARDRRCGSGRGAPDAGVDAAVSGRVDVPARGVDHRGRPRRTARGSRRGSGRRSSEVLAGGAVGWGTGGMRSEVGPGGHGGWRVAGGVGAVDGATGSRWVPNRGRKTQVRRMAKRNAAAARLATVTATSSGASASRPSARVTARATVVKPRLTPKSAAGDQPAGGVGRGRGARSRPCRGGRRCCPRLHATMATALAA